MSVIVTSFWLSKAGNTRAEYEDAFCPKDDGERQEGRLHVGIADGASEGMLNGKWAEILVETFYHLEALSGDTLDFLERACNAWSAWKENYLLEREKHNRPIQWFEEPWLQAGAFSTFLGLTLLEEASLGKWEAVAVGDSCLFQIRGEDLILKFPVAHSSDFNNRPLLICSNPSRNQGVLGSINRTEGDWCAGDLFCLMTDALAHWFLREYEGGQAPWRILCDLLTTTDRQQSFEKWVQELRMEKQMRNDDVTLISIGIV